MGDSTHKKSKHKKKALQSQNQVGFGIDAADAIATSIYESMSERVTDALDGIAKFGDSMYHYVASPELDYGLKALKDDAVASLANMERHSCFHSMPQLFLELFSILDAFVVNQIAAQMFYKRLCSFAITLAHPNRSIFRRTELRSYTGPTLSISVLESVANILSRAIRYLFRFTTENALVEIFAQTDLKIRLIEFDSQLTTAIIAVSRIVEFDAVITFDRHPPDYVVVDNLKEAIATALVHRNDALLLMDRLGIPVSEADKFFSDLKSVAQILHRHELAIEREMDDSMVIKQRLLRDIWLDAFGNSHNKRVSLLEFIEALRLRTTISKPTIKDLFEHIHSAFKGNYSVSVANEFLSIDLSEQQQKVKENEKVRESTEGTIDEESKIALDIESIYIDEENSEFVAIEESNSAIKRALITTNRLNKHNSSAKDSTVTSPSYCNEKINQLAISLDGQLVLDENNLFGSGEIAKISRHIPIHEMSFENVLTLLVMFPNAKAIRYLPPRAVPDADIYWDGKTKELLHECMLSSSGGSVVNIYGPKKCGKTTRVLSLLHNMRLNTTNTSNVTTAANLSDVNSINSSITSNNNNSNSNSNSNSKQRDIIYLDFTGCHNHEDMQARVCSQLHLHNSFTDDKFKKSFGRLVCSLHPRSVVVFDGIDNRVIDGLRHFHRIITESIEETEQQRGSRPLSQRVILVYVSITMLANDIKVPQSKLRSQVLFRLGDDSSERFAIQLYPADPYSVFVGGCRHPGYMVCLARYCSLSIIRLLKKEVNRDGGASVLTKWDSSSTSTNISTSFFYDDIGQDMTGDESLLASLLFRGLPPFQMALAWALSKTYFQGNLCRWYNAWNGLLSIGWLQYDADVGYWIEVHATVPFADSLNTLNITFQGQWDEYLYYWALQLARIHDSSAENALDFSYINDHRPHFNALFACFVTMHSSTNRHSAITFGPSSQYKSRPKLIKDLICSDCTILARMLAGRISKVSHVVLHANHGQTLAEAIVSYIKEKKGVVYLWAVTDVTIEMIKHGSVVRAIRILESLLARITGDHDRKHCSVAHALAVSAYAHSLLVPPQLDASIKRLTEAIAIWSYLSSASMGNANITSNAAAAVSSSGSSVANSGTSASYVVLMDEKKRLTSQGIDVDEVSLARSRLQEFIAMKEEEEHKFMLSLANDGRAACCGCFSFF